MGYTPTPDQDAIFDQVAEVYRQQFEKADFEAGRLTRDELRWFRPGEPIRYVFRVASGHGFGKTKLVATVANHAFDTLPKLAGYTFSTDWPALRDKLWKDILGDRRGKGLPGTMLEGALRIYTNPEHYLQARSTSDAGGKGKDRVHGLHAPFWHFSIEEADAAEDYVFDAINTNTQDGIGVVFAIGNPKRRTSRFHRMRGEWNVRSFTFSSLDHVNVRAGRAVIPGGAVSRQWVAGMIETNATRIGFVPQDVVDRAADLDADDLHAGGERAQRVRDGYGPGAELIQAYGQEVDPDEDSFCAFWHTVKDGAGRERIPVFRPDDDFRYQVLGLPPRGRTDNTFVPAGRIESARRRGKRAERTIDGITPAEEAPAILFAPGGGPDDPRRLTIGIDPARFGADQGTVYARWRTRVWRAATVVGQDSSAYLDAVVELVRKVKEASEYALPHPDEDRHPEGVVRQLQSVVIRIDATGGYGAGPADKIKDAAELNALVPNWTLVEVGFGNTPAGMAADGLVAAVQVYDDLATQIYDLAGEALRELYLGGPALDAPLELDLDLADRVYTYATRGRRERKKLEPKDRFKKRVGRSPDDGDGFALAVAPDSAFAKCRTTEGGGQESKRERKRGRLGGLR